MKLNNIILTENEGISHTYKAITKEKAIELLLTKCSDSLENFKKGYSIWRVARYFDEYYLVDPTKGTRKSRNTGNFYTILLSRLLPSWKGLPRRDKGIIGFNGRKHMNKRWGYDALGGFAVFPVNTSKKVIGVCRDYDIWKSFPELEEFGLHDLDDLNEFFWSLNSDLPEEYKSFGDELHQLTSMIEFFKDNAADPFNAIPSRAHKKLFTAIAHDGRGMIEFLDKIMDPKKNGFEFYSTKNYNVNPSRARETWVSHPSVFVQEQELDKIKGELGLE